MGFQHPQCEFCGRKLTYTKVFNYESNVNDYKWVCLMHGVMYPEIIKSKPMFLEDFGILKEELTIPRERWVGLKKKW